MNDASDELFQTLLRELFQGQEQALRGLLQPLTAQQRKALFEAVQRPVQGAAPRLPLRAGCATHQPFRAL